MLKQIWKYAICTDDSITIFMPEDAQILTLQMQFGKPTIWALVDPYAAKTARTFEVYKTGRDMLWDQDITRKYIGTYQLYRGELVYHVFEREK